MAGKIFLLVGALALLLAWPALLATPVAGRTIGQIVRADRELTDLAYVLRTHNAGGELDDRRRTLTVFAPTNGAFRKLGRCFGVPSPQIQAVMAFARKFATVDFDQDVRRSVLYHATPGARSWKDLRGSVGYQSLLRGSKYWVSTSADDQGLVGVTPHFPVARVLNRGAPIRADNGLIYKVDLPLLPYDVPPQDIRSC